MKEPSLSAFGFPQFYRNISWIFLNFVVPFSQKSCRATLYTGAFGDGKIFVYNVENVVKVRTGGQGYDALQDEEAK